MQFRWRDKCIYCHGLQPMDIKEEKDFINEYNFRLGQRHLKFG